MRLLFRDRVQYNSTIGLHAFWHIAWIDSDGICFSRLRMPSVKLGLVRRCWRVRSATQRFLSCKITYFLAFGAGAPDFAGRKRCLLLVSWYTEALLAICRRAHAMEQSLTATKQTFRTRYTILVGLCAAARHARLLSSSRTEPGLAI